MGFTVWSNNDRQILPEALAYFSGTTKIDGRYGGGIDERVINIFLCEPLFRGGAISMIGEEYGEKFRDAIWGNCSL